MPLHLQTLTTDALGPYNRFEHWRDLSLNALFGVRADAAGDAAAAFNGRVTSWSGAAFTRFSLQSTAMTVTRSSQEIARRSWNSYLVYRECRPGVELTFGGTVFAPEPGDLVIWDADEPFSTRTAGEFGYEGWMLPKPLMVPHLRAGGERPQHLSTGSGVPALLRAFLAGLENDMGTLEGQSSDLVIDNLARLVGIALGTAAGPHDGALRAAKLAQARRYIDSHLTDTRLSPSRAAASLGLSLRQLHGLFETNGATFAEQVQRQRLQECRRVLQSPAASGRSVTDIAFAWGFGSLPTFYRAFQHEFGMAPGDMRPARGASRP